MQNENINIVIKGAGEVASGVAYYLFSRGLKRIIMTEIQDPTVQRRTVAFAEAVFSGSTEVLDVNAEKAESVDDVLRILNEGKIAVLVDPKAEIVNEIEADVLIDGTMAKEDLGTKKGDADLVIGLGPGFEAGRDVDVVVETIPGPSAGKVIYSGRASPNTSIPSEIDGYTKKRVIRSPASGIFNACLEISSSVQKGEEIGSVDGEKVIAKMSGTIRGLVKGGLEVIEGQKLGDIDPRARDEFSITERSLSVGKGVWKIFYLK